MSSAASPTAPEAARRWYASGAAILALFLVLLLPNVLQGFQATDTDMFCHLACARWMAEHRTVLDREVFSFTREGTPWVDYTWLSQLFPWLAFEAGGLTGLFAWRTVLILGSVALLWRMGWEKSGKDRLVATAVALAVFAGYFARGMNLRPHAWSYLGLILLLLLLERMWRTPRRFDWRVPLICVLWANLHGIEQPIVFAVIGIHALAALAPRLRAGGVAAAWRDWDWLRWPALLAACIAAFLVTPYGFELWRTIAQPFDQEAMAHLMEMQPYSWQYFFSLAPPGELGLTTTINYLVVLSLLVLPWWIRRGELRAPLLLALGVLLALVGARFLAECAILVSAGVALELGRLREQPGLARRLGTGIAAMLVVFVAVASAGNVRRGVREGFYANALPRALPAGPARFLKANELEGRLLHPATYGGYLEWELSPKIRVFADMRMPVPFDAEILWIDLWLHASGGAGEARALFANVVARWHVDYVLLRRGLGLSRDLWTQPGRPFALVFADQEWVLFARRERLAGEHAGLELRLFDPFGNPAESIAKLAPAERATLRAETETLVAESPDDPLARRFELQLLFQEGRTAEAGRLADDLVARFPRVAAYRLAAAGAAQTRGEGATAFEHLRAALAIEPGDLGAAAAAGRQALLLGRAQEGRVLLERTLALREYHLPVAEFQLLGDLRAAAGAPLEAVEAYERALLLCDDPARRPAVAEALAGAFTQLERAASDEGDVRRARQLLRRIAAAPGAPPEMRERARSRLEH